MDVLESHAAEVPIWRRDEPAHRLVRDAADRSDDAVRVPPAGLDERDAARGDGVGALDQLWVVPAGVSDPPSNRSINRRRRLSVRSFPSTTATSKIGGDAPRPV